MIINIYSLQGEKIVENMRVNSVYDSKFYFRNMPTISGKRCRDILKKLYPHFKAESTTLLFENVATGYKGLQDLHINGTILNF